jgi:hypothetical protein
VAWPLNFRLTDAEVQVRLGGWVLRRVRLDDIEAVTAIAGLGFFSSREFWGWNEHWCNFSPMRFVILRRKSGWVRNFVINPPSAEKFIDELTRKAPHLT